MIKSRVLISDPQPSRLAEIRHIHAQFRSKVLAEYIQVSDLLDNDAVVNQLKRGSLVVNASGLGKDAPGSPLTDAARLPASGIVWELNYRGALVFLRQANAQKVEPNLQIEDGWTYFIHGWTRVIAYDAFKLIGFKQVYTPLPESTPYPGENIFRNGLFSAHS